MFTTEYIPDHITHVLKPKTHPNGVVTWTELPVLIIERCRAVVPEGNGIFSVLIKGSVPTFDKRKLYLSSEAVFTRVPPQ